jgi:GNAT superfamily N-acetyltransferase
MSLPANLTIREARTDDVAAIADMRQSVGWSVHKWALRAVIGQPHARCVVISDTGGSLVGVGSGIAYPPIGFIGNMVVSESHRRRGIGSAILDDIARWLVDVSCTRLELNASEEGRRLYERHGFESRGSSAVARIPRTAPLDGDASAELRPADAADLDALIAYDGPRFGGNRRPVLANLLADSECRAVVAELGGRISGFAVARPAEPRVGPLVADTPEVAARLVGWALETMPAVEDVRLNLPPSNRAGAAWLGDLGVAIETWDGRMARGPDVPRRDETIYQMTVGPLG